MTDVDSIVYFMTHCA